MANQPIKSNPAPTALAKDKAEAFRNLASKRVNNALTKIAVIGNLANKNSYDFNGEHVQIIEKALHDEVDKTVKRFADALAGKKVSAAGAFKL